MARRTEGPSAEVRAYMSEIGKKGGAKGGRAAAASMTPEERRERARKGGLAGGRGRPKKAKKAPPATRGGPRPRQKGRGGTSHPASQPRRGGGAKEA